MAVVRRPCLVGMQVETMSLAVLLVLELHRLLLLVLLLTLKAELGVWKGQRPQLKGVGAGCHMTCACCRACWQTWVWGCLPR